MNNNKIDNQIGKMYGPYKVIEYTGRRTKDNHKIYKIICDICGKEIYKSINYIIKRKKYKCPHKDKTNKLYLITGTKKEVVSRLRLIYYQIGIRYYDKNCKYYKYYGGKGIEICSEWLNDYFSFQEWAVNNGYKDNLTIDRINSDGNYCPENCRWITSIENSKYKKSTNFITVNGIVDSGRGWSKRLGLGINNINRFLRKNGLDLTIEYIKNEIIEHESASFITPVGIEAIDYTNIGLSD